MKNYRRISPRRFKMTVKNLQSVISYWRTKFYHEYQLCTNWINEVAKLTEENHILKKNNFWLLVALVFSTICHIIYLVLCLVK